MKKLGIINDIQTGAEKKKLIIKKRHISPDAKLLESSSSTIFSQGGKKVMHFPFQRRARSLDGCFDVDASASDAPIKPVKVKDNFLLAHKGIVPGVSRLVKQNER
jgi:hypothetical protein